MKPYNTIRTTLGLSGLQQPAGPEGLTSAICTVRDAAARPMIAHLSNDEVGEVISAAFYASQSPEEGRYPTFRLLSYPLADKDDQLRTLLSFDDQPQLELSTETLRRLAPAIADRRFALRVDSHDGVLKCTKIVLWDPGHSVAPPGRPELWTTHRPTGLMVQAERPGELRVSEDATTVMLRAGQVVELAAVDFVPAVVSWTRECADRLLSEMTSKDRRAESYFGGDIQTLFRDFWSRVLHTTVEARHGGTFVLVPDGAAKPIEHKYTVGTFRIRDELSAFWMQAINATDSGDAREHSQVLGLWARVRSVAAFLAGLANVDGCVALSRDLDLIGFAGVIDAPMEFVEGSSRPLVDASTGVERSDQGLKQFGGMRHQSAAAYVRATPGALAFVVSQDGDLRVFSSNDDSYVAFKDLAPDLMR